LSKEETQKHIDEYGCSIIYILEDNYLPGFAYTIGLHQKFNHPEIICFGLPKELTGSILNDACDLIKKGQSFEPGIQYKDFLEDFILQFLAVDKSFYPNYFGKASNFYGNNDYSALQLVWPDKQQLFPWEPDFNPAWKRKQPLLDRDTDFKFNEERNVAVFTTKQVFQGSPILYVYHNDDGDWQFHSEQDPKLEHSMIVCLEEITKLDPGINDLYHLSYGQSAWRNSKEDDWEWE
jgi:hypothetical protein